jgi:hypothetical protein
MTTLVYLTNRAPSRLTGDLIRAGYRVFEAFEVSHVLRLCETESVDAVVIGADVDDPDVVEAQMRIITLKMASATTVKELVWELVQLFPGQSALVQ